jgi:crotonobetainyl-CoA:carnitine CoA-transferase CaiB-like acyl-CoA transferase
MFPLTTASLVAGIDPEPPGSAHPNIVPYQVFRCGEGYAAVGVTNERIWRRFCEALERGEWAEDPRFRTNADRNRNRAELLPLLEPILLERSAMEWETVFRSADVPCGAVRTVTQALGFETVRSVWSLDDGVRIFGNPVEISDHEPPKAGAPKLGEHTALLRAEFGE